MKSLVKFFTYNNAVPIAISFILLGAGGAFAATDPGAIYSAQQQVITVDNTYIANKDLTTWTPTIQITGVTEDTDNYYIAYTLSTINVVNYVWQNVNESEVLTVSKADLGGNDLGVYATGIFHNIIANELSYLEQVQTKARQETTQETVATTYGGLIGKMLTENTQTLPGYTPVVQPPQESSSSGNSGNESSSGSPSSQGGATSGSTPLLSIQILGNNPATIIVGSGYVDLGAVIIDPTDPNIGYHAYVDGVEETTPTIDTSATSTHSIEYRATDQVGNTASVTRVVNVVPVGTPIPSSTNTTPPPVNTDTSSSASPAQTTTTSSSSSGSQTSSPQSSSSETQSVSSTPTSSTTSTRGSSSTSTTTPNTNSTSTATTTVSTTDSTTATTTSDTSTTTATTTSSTTDTTSATSSTDTSLNSSDTATSTATSTTQ